MLRTPSRPDRRVSHMLVAALCLFLIVVCIGPILFVAMNAAKSSAQYWQSKFSPPNDLGEILRNSTNSSR